MQNIEMQQALGRRAAAALALLLIAPDGPAWMPRGAGVNGQSVAAVRSFSPECNWTWVGGSSSPGVANSDTVFGARHGHALAVANGTNGPVFVFGGSTQSQGMYDCEK